ncbi:MAG: glycoside hydrolase family 88 protein [Prevotellaceae bacterium]|nr:glycoside hydrolase family 88 protein [Prevotellaceae bacterium]
MNMKSIFAAALSFSLLVACSPESKPAFDVDAELNYCDAQIHCTLNELRNQDGVIDYTMAPRNIPDSLDTWQCRKTTKEEWCNGFFPGILWYDYEYTGDDSIKYEAEKFTEPLKFLSEIPAYDHDFGFLVFCSYGNAYRLTKNPEYKKVILDAADTLATLFNPAVGTILSWPRNVKMYGGHNTIMDNMMNLEMLFWASKNGGDKRLYDIAVSHAEKTMKYHFREDATSYHVAVYDTLSGDFLYGCTHQGYADSSMWARGQAWAIYGYTVVYRETKDKRFLDFAQKVTDVYLSRLPENYVPYWDFDDPSIPNAPRDASAACVVASALLELSSYVADDKAAEYKNAAVKMLESLSTDTYQSRDAKPSFLLHSVGHKPAGSEIDASIVYADYYYIEALLRLKKTL